MTTSARKQTIIAESRRPDYPGRITASWFDGIMSEDMGHHYLTDDTIDEHVDTDAGQWFMYDGPLMFDRDAIPEEDRQ